jgi:hypothetical protein
MPPEMRPNSDRPREALEARLRALPQPPVPADLEARLLATIPAAVPGPRRHPAVWVGVGGALAAACLLAVLAWSGRDGERPVPSPPTSASALQAPSRPPDGAAGLPVWLEARRNPDGPDMPPFTWPLEEKSAFKVSTSIPPDLLD